MFGAGLENSLPKKNRDYRIAKLKYGEFYLAENVEMASGG